jgi:diguanylate cyclase (GGDEF)-like protein
VSKGAQGALRPAATASVGVVGRIGAAARLLALRHGVTVYVTTVCVTALAVLVTSVAVALPLSVDPWVVVLMLSLCGLADVAIIHIRFGHNRESFTFAEVTVVVGLFLVGTAELVMFAGTCVLLCHLVRRNRLIKAFFNASNFALSTALAGLVFDLLAPPTPAPLSRTVVVALVVATVVFYLANSLATAAAVAWSQGMRVLDVYLYDGLVRTVVTLLNCVAGLLVLALLQWSAYVLVVLPAVLITMYFAYRGYLQARQEREVWQQLEASTRELNVLEERHVAIAALRRTQTLFRPDGAELLVTGRPGRPDRLYTLDANDALNVREGTLGATSSRTTTYVELDSDGRDQPVVTCLSAPLDGPKGRIGALHLLFGGPVRLTSRERQVLSTFAHAVSTTLLNAALYEDVRAEAVRKAHEASHDHLTGLANRSLLKDTQAEAIDRNSGTTALLLLDLDHFKEINDTLGHAAGDVLLQEVGRRLRSFAGDRHLVARLGGDEFAVLLTGLRRPRDAEPVAEQLLALLSAPVEFEGLRLSVEASIGVACHPQDATTSEELFRRADVAMYQAKSTRGQWLRYSAERDDSSVHRQALVAELRAALDHDQIVVHYQPQVDLETGLVVGAEALCRWEHPTRGLLPPGEFVSVAEHSGLVRPFTLRVLDQAVAQCVTWQEHGRPISVAVNLSARSLLDRQLPDDVRAVLLRHGLPPDRLVLEITETTATSELEVVEDVLSRLRLLGVEVSVDDFGTGYSSLAFLQRTAVHELKVDRTFVAGMLTSENDLALVRATVNLARSLGARSVAEGVEDGAQAAALREMGCDVAQGFWLSKPLPAAAIRTLLGLRVTADNGGAQVPGPRTPELRVVRPSVATSA